MNLYNYDRLIADAARNYLKAQRENAIMQTEKTSLAEESAFARLAWAADAEKHGWDPESYEED